jgi:DNA-binding CsgD family transcriptional regulator
VAASHLYHRGAMRDPDARRLRRELSELADSGLEWAELATRASSLLRRHVTFDKACWHSLDPESLVLTGALKEGIHRDEPRLPRYEASVDDFNKFAYLAGCNPPVGILSQATRGNLAASARFRDILASLGIGWELRAVFCAGGAAWGACSLYRSPDAADFGARDAELVAAVVDVLGTGFRRSLLLHGLAMPSSAHGPGLVLLDDADAVKAITPAAERWLAHLVDIGPTRERRLPSPVYSAAARARASGMARARVFTPSGGGLLLHANRLATDDRNLVAVIVEPASAADVAELKLEAYGLTARERQISELVLEGASTAAIAGKLHLSPLTVQDYLKSVFDKTGVRSRRDLVGRLLAQRSQVAIPRDDWAEASAGPERGGQAGEVDGMATVTHEP